ncbi:uncharacterized protein LOC128556279 isoform X2 [Mercenaria mercenaria]|nr:uncharacterized protein LOC128556279 isoform X2 [Mercenaria mercenaria]
MEVKEEDLQEMGITKIGLRKSFFGAIKKVREGHIGTHDERKGLQLHEVPPVKKSLAENKFGLLTPVATKLQSSTSNRKEKATGGTPKIPSKAATPRRKMFFDTDTKGSPQRLITTMLSADSPSTHPTARSKGIKIYSEREIRDAKGLDKERLPFWNSFVEELCKNQNLSKLEVHGIVDYEWRLRKTDLLLNEASESMAKKGIDERVERMKEARKRVEEEYKNVKEARVQGRKTAAGIIEVENLLPAFTELKKAQDCVQKCLRKKSVKQKAICIEESHSDLDDIDVEGIVTEIKNARNTYDNIE